MVFMGWGRYVNCDTGCETVYRYTFYGLHQIFKGAVATEKIKNG
jgi:hypothetical protein